MAIVALGAMVLGGLFGLRYGLARIALCIMALVAGPALAAALGRAVTPFLSRALAAAHLGLPEGMVLPLLTALVTALLLGLAVYAAGGLVNALPVVGGFNRVGGLLLGAAGAGYAALLFLAAPGLRSPGLATLSQWLPYWLAPLGGR